LRLLVPLGLLPFIQLMQKIPLKLVRMGRLLRIMLLKPNYPGHCSAFGGLVRGAGNKAPSTADINAASSAYGNDVGSTNYANVGSTSVDGAARLLLVIMLLQPLMGITLGLPVIMLELLVLLLLGYPGLPFAYGNKAPSTYAF